MASTTKRRKLLGAGAAALASAAAGPAHPDAPLLQACAEFKAIERRNIGLHRGPDQIDDDRERDIALEPL